MGAGFVGFLFQGLHQALTGTGAADSDGDDLTNAQEYVLGTHPQTGDAARMSPALAGGMVNFSFTAIKAEGSAYTGLTRRYTLKCTTTLGSGAEWVGVTGYIGIVGNNKAIEISLPTDGALRFYRIKVTLGP